MSCYEWESGHVKLPAKDWPKFRKKMLQAWNAHELEFLETAKTAHRNALAAAKGTRGKNRLDRIRKAIAKACGGRIDPYGQFTTEHVGERHKRDGSWDLWYAVTFAILKGDGLVQSAPRTLQAPKKKDLKLVSISKTDEHGTQLSIGEATATFKDSSKTVYWSVPENNHAREYARDHWFAKLLFAELARVPWSRNTGGVIVGNDEYNCDNDTVGGGGNYVVTAFGPIGAKISPYTARF